MPKRNPPPEAVAPVAALVAPPPPSPLIATLRKDWRWAAISQFIWTFSDAFGLVDWDIEELETDLDGDETHVLPTVLAKLLFALTYNRQINRDNAFDNLRKTYLKRVPETTPFGTLEEPIEWATLGLSQKVKVIHELCEWQLENPARFRALLKTEDEEATWRVDPLGWDKLGNTYYLFDDNRLWIQRVPPAPPRPPKKASLKAKRADRALRRSKPPSKKSHKKKEAAPASSPAPAAKIEEPVSGTRKRTQVSFFGNLTPTVAALKRGGSSQSTPASTRGMRSSSRLQGGSTTEAPETPSKQTPSRRGAAPIPLGTRVSRRLREVDDEWQQVPEEWLSPEKKAAQDVTEHAGRATRGANGKSNGKGKAKSREEDEDSELSELTDEEEHQKEVDASRAAGADQPSDDVTSEGNLTPVPDEATEAKDEEGSADTAELTPAPEETKAEPESEVAVKGESEATAAEDDKMDIDAKEEDEEEAEQDEDEVKFAAKKANDLPEGFVEWEAVCVTLYDWRTFPEQFANSRDADEKALYEMLQDQVGPTIIEQLIVKEQERIKQQAVMNRKRSSRIATKELEREEILRRQEAEQEMEQRMASQRLQEKRIAKEEAEAAAREKAREDRLKEREERAQAREEAIIWKEQEKERELQMQKEERERRKRRRLEGHTASGASTPNAAASQERWELSCEICKLQGWNIDEDKDLVSCDSCGKWQHVECHDQYDLSQKRQPRNWDKVDFKCQECLRRAAKKRQRMSMDAAAQAANGHPPQYQVVNGMPGHPAAPPPPPPGQYYAAYPPNGHAPPGIPPNYPYAPHPGQPVPQMSPAYLDPQGQRLAHPPHPQQDFPPQQPQFPPGPQQRSVPHQAQHPFGPDHRNRPAPPPMGQPVGYVNGHGQHVPHPGHAHPVGPPLPYLGHPQGYPGPPRQSPQHPVHPQLSPQHAAPLHHTPSPHPPTPSHHGGHHPSHPGQPHQSPSSQGLPRQSPQHGPPPPHAQYAPHPQQPPPHYAGPPRGGYSAYPPQAQPSASPHAPPRHLQQWSPHNQSPQPLPPHSAHPTHPSPSAYHGGPAPTPQGYPRQAAPAAGPPSNAVSPSVRPVREQAQVQRRPSQGVEGPRA